MQGKQLSRGKGGFQNNGNLSRVGEGFSEGGTWWRSCLKLDKEGEVPTGGDPGRRKITLYVPMNF